MSVFQHSRVIPANPEAVFAAFEDPTRLARWWGPAGFTNTFETFEFQPGGTWRFTMHGPDGTDYPNQAEFLEILPPSRVRLQHVKLPRFELSLSLEPSGDGTLVTWVGVFENQEFAENMRTFLEGANEQNLDRLVEEVRAAPASKLICPLCGQPNDCLGAQEGGDPSKCWCNAINFNPTALARVPPEYRNKICICRQCATAPARP